MTQRWDWTYRHGRRLLAAAIVSVVVLATTLAVAVAVLGEQDSGCVVGRWRTVESQQHLSGDFGTLILDDDGPVETYRADGSAESDYGDGVQYRVTDTLLGLADGTGLVISGTASYDFTLENGTIQYENVNSKLLQESDYLPEVPTSFEDVAYQYRCEGDTMTFHIADRYDARLVRLD